MKKNIFLTILIFSFYVISFAQDGENTYVVKFDSLINKIIFDNYRPYSLIVDMKAQDHPDQFIPLLKKYENIPNSDVQNRIYACYYEYGITYRDVSFKQAMMMNLLNACSNIDSVELSYACIQSVKYLMDFDNKLFNKEMIDIINTRASLNDRIFIYYAGLSGKLYQKNMIPIFEKKLFEAKRDTEKYQLNQILARLGRQKSVLAIQDSLRKMNIEDRLWQENVFLYVRQKPVIDLLLKDLLSNERGTSYFEGWMEKPLEKICAYDALKLLSKIVKDFPVKGKENYSEFDLEIARSWIKKHKNDYIIGE